MDYYKLKRIAFTIIGNDLKYLNHLVILLVILLVGINLNPVFYVKPGFTILHLRLGKIINEHTQPGAYIKIPLIDSLIKINQRIKKTSIETGALSKDLQAISIGAVINYQIKDATKIYRSVGRDFVRVIIDPFSQESIKAIIAQYNAEDLIQHRHEAKEKIYLELKNRLERLSIDLVDFNFVHSDFSKDFMKSVEEKQIAEQKSKMAKHLTQKIKEEALQTQAKADAESYSLQVKRENLSTDLIAFKRIEIIQNAIEKWNGRLPNVMSNADTFLKVD